MPVLLCLFAIFFSPLVMASDFAAKVIALNGESTAQLQQQRARKLNKNDLVYSGDLITTSDNSSLTLLFSDGSKFELAENTQFEISQYLYEKNVEKDSFSTLVIKGTFRVITGLIASNKPSAMEVNLPVATIGIRGTHVVAEASHNYAKVILLEPEQSKSTAIEVYNQFGSVVVDKPGYGTEVPDEFSPPSPVRRMQARTIDNMMRSIQNVQRIRVPRPMM